MSSRDDKDITLGLQERPSFYIKAPKIAKDIAIYTHSEVKQAIAEKRIPSDKGLAETL